MFYSFSSTWFESSLENTVQYVTAQTEHMKAWTPTGRPGNTPVTNVPHILTTVTEWMHDV